ncbi:DUF4393 domain-containing protein [Bacillus sp. SM2101]|uniref:DUF4393 domain-containing protein n=1 Tax=Bacillus sp. SM2101 TaxID=2805366 RepID=UPI001BDF5682|nr:DUF4393 domain-containing protein [Bacillus sp. SM2101]
MDITTIGTAIGTSLLTSFATSKGKDPSAPIQTLNDLWYLTFGRLQLFTEQKRAKHAASLEEYKNNLVKEISSIPDENLIEPPLSIVGPALENSKFYIEENELRNMFAKLVASSMDNRKSTKTHHAFIEIIKQLSPIDAQNIALLKDHRYLPIANFNLNNYANDKKQSRLVIIPDVFLSNPNCDDVELLRSSITNIKRLGLVDTYYDIKLKNEQLYETFDNNQYLKSLGQPLLDARPGAETFFEKGFIEFSSLGNDFKFVCL